MFSLTLDIVKDCVQRIYRVMLKIETKVTPDIVHSLRSWIFYGDLPQSCAVI